MNKGKRAAKKAFALLLSFVMVVCMMPSMAFADIPADTVSIYAAASDLTFQTEEGQTIAADMTQSGEYQKYSLNNVSPGTYMYSSKKYGTGKLRITGSDEVYLRVVDFTFTEGGIPFHMTVTNTEDKELVYTSPKIDGGLSAQLLVPALGWGTTYQFDFCPDEEGWCSFYGPLWVTKSSQTLQGFKQGRYNLSDGGVYTMGNGKEVTIKVPTGATLGVYSLIKFYRAPIQYHSEFIKTDGEYDVYKVTVPNKVYGTLYYTVSKAGNITTSKIFSSTEAEITVSADAISGDPQTQVKQSYEASLLSNGNRAKFISLQPGEEFAIWTSRAWQAVNDTTSNKYVEPDKHYYLVDGDAVKIDQLGTVTGVKEGTAIVAMTYDAMNYGGQLYSAVDSDSIAVFAFSVGKSSEGITTGLINSTDLDTHYVASTVTMDGSDTPVATNDSTEYTFTPTDEKGEKISVRVCTVEGYPTPQKTSWKSYDANQDGSFTIELYPGRNVVEISAGDRAAYHVLNCKATNVAITNDSAPGQTPKQDESVTVRFDNIITPLPKLGAIYNPGFGGTVYLEGTLTDPLNETQTVTSEGVQYNLGDTAAISVPLTEAGLYSLSDMRIHSGGFGSAPGTHLALSRQSDGGTYTGGDAPESAGYYSYLPKISFTTENADHEATAKAVTELIKKIGDVEYTPECQKRIQAARNAYDSASTQVKKLISDDVLKLLTDAETQYLKLEEKDIEENIKTETIDGEEFYVLTNTEQLKWFAKVINGTLANGNEAKTDANAILGKDITVNEAVLGDDFTLMNKRAEQWTSIGIEEKPFTGIFDGDGHSINGIYQVSATAKYMGLFSCNGGTIRNLAVGDSYFYSTNAEINSIHIGGISGANTSTGIIDNVKFHGYAGSKSSTNKFGAGISASNEGTIRNSVLEGKIEAGLSGGIVGRNGGSIEKCVNNGTVLSPKGSAGGIAYSSYGSIRNCYSTSMSKIQGKEITAGIVSWINSGTIASCYNAGKVSSSSGTASGIYSEKDSLAVVVQGISYYLQGSASSGSIDGIVIRKTAAQFASGEVAYLLGDSFGQRIGEDEYPVFLNDTNIVLYVDGSYVNNSASSVDKLIEGIGGVGLNGDDNCFTRVTEAQKAYDSLSEAEKAKVAKNSVLTQKQKDYENAVSELNDLIAALKTIDANSGDAITSAKTGYQSYINKGGDLNLIENVGRIQEAEDEFFKFREENIEKGIEKRTVDGKGYYVLTNADELFWFAKLVNGSLSDDRPAVSDANALLDADITVNENLLNAILVSGVTTDQTQLSLQRQWTPMNTFKGIFDGQGHSVSGLCATPANINPAFISSLNGGTIRNIELKDTYFSGTHAAGIAQNLSNGGLIEHCGVTGVLSGTFRGGGIALSGKNCTIRDCFYKGKIWIQRDIQNSTYIGGVIGAIEGNSVTIENCYSACDFGSIGTAGGIIGMAGKAADTTLKNCYFEKSSRVDIPIGDNRGNYSVKELTACTAEQFASGEIAYKLGKAFGQDLANDVYPEFRNATNTVYAVNGSYYNRSLQVVKALIDDIGTVGLDGSEDCFQKVEDASAAFDTLSKDMQKAIGADYRDKLQQAQDAYDDVVKALTAEITALRPFSKDVGDSAYNALLQKLDQYTERKGDTERISNYGELDNIKAELDAAMIQWKQEDIEASMKTKVGEDGKTYYILTTADELSWFTDLVNGDLKTGIAQNSNANAVLGSNIVCNENLVSTIISELTVDKEKAAACSASTSMKSFGGIIDGNGYKISGLYLPTGSFIESLGAGAQIKDLMLRDAVIANGNGGFAKSMEGGASISGCTFDGVLLSASANTGGIAGEVKASAAVEKCTVKGYISSTLRYTGGVAGKNAGKISKCKASDLEITTSQLQAYSAGIAGENSGSIENCYARGTVSAKNKGMYMAGLCAQNKGTVNSCYSAVGLKNALASNCGAIAGNNTGTIGHCYYLEGINGNFKGIGTNADVEGQTESRTADQFKDGTVTKELGEAFVQQGDYPELADLVKSYKLTVVKGTDVTGTGAYSAGTEVSIKADAAPEGQIFDQWTADVKDVVFADASKTETTFTMPEEDVTITATYKAKEQPEDPSAKTTVTFRLVGDAKHGSSKDGHAYTTWIATKSYTFDKSSVTVGEVFAKALGDAGLSYDGLSSNYIRSITAPKAYGGYTLAEKENGPNSGWMYTVNGKHPNKGLNNWEVKTGDQIVWHYVDDYLYEVSDWFGGSKGDSSTWDKWLNAADVNPPTDGTIVDMGGGAQPSETSKDISATVKDGEATSKVTADDIDKLIDDAVNNKATNIGINVKNADKADKVSVELPKTSVSNIANRTDAALNVKTPLGNVELDKTAMKSVAGAASGSDLTIVLEKQTAADDQKTQLGDNAAVTKVTILSGGKEITDLGAAKIKLSLPISGGLKDKTIAAVYTDAEGKLVKVTGKTVTIDGRQYYQIETSKPETFTLAEAAKIDEAIGAQAGETDEEKLERIKKGVQNTTIKITKTSKGKGWIRINYRKSKGYKVDYYEVFRKTGKNTKFTKKAFYKTKKNGLTGWYKNTKSLKKGKRYYYKIRGVRVLNGKKYYTKWSNTVYRIAK